MIVVPYCQFPDLLFDHEKHLYTWRGCSRRSVTQVLSNVGTRDSKGNWKGIADDRWVQDEVARDFGNAFHKMGAFDLRGELGSIPEALTPWHQTFKRWRSDYAFLRPLLDANGVPIIEYPMYHETLYYCGTPDLVAEAIEPCPKIYRNTIVVCDWKTSTTEMQHWKAQCAAYAKLVQHVFGERVRGKKIIWAAFRFEENRYDPQERFNNPEDFTLFQSALNILGGA